MISQNLQLAIDSLDIQDVYVRELEARCATGFEPKYFQGFDSLTVQTKHLVKKAEMVRLDSDGELLRVFVELGARWVAETAEDESQTVKAFVEAEFVAEYTVKEKLEQECINEFAQKNASYHVWPFWREILSSQCLKMYLPKVVLPIVQLSHHRLGNSAGREPTDT